MCITAMVTVNYTSIIAQFIQFVTFFHCFLNYLRQMCHNYCNYQSLTQPSILMMPWMTFMHSSSSSQAGQQLNVRKMWVSFAVQLLLGPANETTHAWCYNNVLLSDILLWVKCNVTTNSEDVYGGVKLLDCIDTSQKAKGSNKDEVELSVKEALEKQFSP